MTWTDGNTCRLRLEWKGVGPTYRLYFVVEEENQKLRVATSDDLIEKIKIIPDIGMGLYDDWEDDLGVPWALPLSDYKKA
jgi:hypothetical protein